MEKLNSATDQLDAALSRLEGAIESLFERAGDPGVVRRELAAMAQDRANLAEELDASMAREKQLQKLADEASAALGSAIDEVRAALNRNEGS
jgi:division protein CdvB (Snf7/Vps24/ESCRT-III family)